MIGGCRAPNLPVEAMAFLGALAIGESDPEVTGSDEVYSVLFGRSHFIMGINAPGEEPQLDILTPEQGWPYVNPINVWPKTFPAWPGVWIGGVPTHAAGRYQFEPRTWAGQQQKLNLPDFGPVSQDLAAWDLAKSVYWLKLQPRTLLIDLQAGNLGAVAAVLRSTWTSLSSDTFADRYNQCLTPSSC